MARSVSVIVALAVAACAACALARPGNDNLLPDTNTIVDVSSKADGSNTKADLPAVETKPSASSTEPSAAQASSEEPAKQEAITLQPVNEKYPHAVLFGGTCGGSIISPKWIITAGHCTLFTGGHYILAGTNRSWDDSGVSVRVKQLVLHPKFSVGPYWLDAEQFDIKQVAARWDFLLAELEEPLVLDGKVMAAAELDDVLSHPEGTKVGYAGYGALRHGETMREDMHGMELQILDDAKCQEKLVQYETDDMVCTQGTPPNYDSACNGDSGSGLVDTNGKLIGIASWVQDDSIECKNGKLVVFSKIAAVRDWIRQVTRI